MIELQHITPRLSADDLIRRSIEAEERSVLESIRKHWASEWERADRKRAQREALYFVGIVGAVALAVIGILLAR